MGLNEFAGYLALALSALATGYLAQAYGLRPEPFYLGIAFASAGTALSVLFVRETRHFVEVETRDSESQEGEHLALREILARVTWRDRALSSASQAGMVNNLDDGVAWGLLPIYFAAAGLGVAEIGVIAFVYPAVWSALQLGTGALSDRWGGKRLIASAMLIQAVALAMMALTSGFARWTAAAGLLGTGTAMVYPTLLASIGDVAHPRWRGSAVGAYRFSRDGGYAAGAVVAGALSDTIGMAGAILAVAVLTGLSGLVVVVRMPETLPAPAIRSASVYNEQHRSATSPLRRDPPPSMLGSMFPPIRTLGGLLGLVAMALSFGETVLASVCTSPAGRMPAMEKMAVGETTTMDMRSGDADEVGRGHALECMLMAAHGSARGPRESSDSHCPLTPAVGQGCSAVASLPGSTSSLAFPLDRPSARASDTDLRPDLLLVRSHFRPPRA